jgi:hypothetical protein
MKQKPIEINSIAVMDGKELRFKKPFLLVPKFDATEQVYYLSHRELGIDVAAQSREELIGEVSDEIAFLWSEYALIADEELTLGAQRLKRTLLEMLEEIDVSANVENPPMFQKTVMVDEEYSPEYGPNVRYFEIGFTPKAIDLIVAASEFLKQHSEAEHAITLNVCYEMQISVFVENLKGTIEGYGECQDFSNNATATIVVKPTAVYPQLDVEDRGVYIGGDISLSELKAFKAAHTSQGGQNG